MKKITIILSVILVTFSGCSEFLDVNENENYPVEVEGYLVLPAAQMSMASVYSAYYSVFGSFSVQHWAQNNTSSQYKAYETYTFSGADGVVNSTYRELYVGALSDNEILLRQAEETENWGLYLMSACLKAYGFQYLVDLYDNVPYFEAFKGETDAIFNPAIDGGKEVYDALYVLLDKALEKADPSASFNYDKTVYEQYDLLGAGDLDKWRQFAKSIQLRLLIRQSGAVDVKDKLAELLEDGGFLTSDMSISQFEDSDSKSNPLYESDQRQLNTTNNIRANAVFIYYLDANNDPRKEALITKVNDEYLGMISGSYEIESDVFEAPSTIAKPTLTPTMPVQFMTVAEVELLKAEAALLANDMTSAKMYYEAGVTASFARIGADIGDLLTTSYAWDDAPNKLEAIILQKWVDAADGQRGIEAFIERARTGIPKISEFSDKIPEGTDVTAGLADDEEYVPGTLVYSKLGSTGGVIPNRLPYPNVELNYNSSAAEYKGLADGDVIKNKVWWAQ